MSLNEPIRVVIDSAVAEIWTHLHAHSFFVGENGVSETNLLRSKVHVMCTLQGSQLCTQFSVTHSVGLLIHWILRQFYLVFMPLSNSTQLMMSCTRPCFLLLFSLFLNHGNILSNRHIGGKKKMSQLAVKATLLSFL